MIRRCVWIYALLIMLFSGMNSQAGSKGPTLLVIPARYTLVQFAFDIARLRSVYLLSYRNDGDSYSTFILDKSSQDWLDADPASGGSLFAVVPAHTIIIGSVDERALSLADFTGDGSVTSRIPSLDLKDVVNGLNEHFHFRGTEWRWLAARYQLELNDRNAERRRWGRYGRPGGGRMPPVKKAAPRAASQMERTALPHDRPEVVRRTFERRKTLVISLPSVAEEKGVPMTPEVDPAPVAEDETPAVPDVDDSIFDESAIENPEPFSPSAAEADMAAEDK